VTNLHYIKLYTKLIVDSRCQIVAAQPDAVQRKIGGRCLDLRRRPNDDPRTPGCVAGFCKPDEAPRDRTAWLGM
jgi:hypothetical protein